MSAGRISFPFPAGSRKAGYSAHSVHGLKPGSTAMQVHIRYRTTVGYRKGSSPLHNIQSPQRPGHLLHAIGDSPSAAGAKSPSHSIHPRLGVRSRHHGVHRYAKQRIFRPAKLTRILHHCKVSISYHRCIYKQIFINFLLHSCFSCVSNESVFTKRKLAGHFHKKFRIFKAAKRLNGCLCL